MPRRKNLEYARKLLPKTIDDVFAAFGVDLDTTVDRHLINTFYAGLNEHFSPDVVLYIPSPEAILPQLNEKQQAFVFADYAVRKIAPMELEAAGFKSEAAKLRKLHAIVDAKTAAAAVNTIEGFYESILDYERAAEENFYNHRDSYVESTPEDRKRALDHYGDARATFVVFSRARAAAHIAADLMNYSTSLYLIADSVSDAVANASRKNDDETWVIVTQMLSAL